LGKLFEMPGCAIRKAGIERLRVTHKRKKDVIIIARLFANTSSSGPPLSWISQT
jgi:hypothetical protein